MKDEIRTKIKAIVLNSEYKPRVNCILSTLKPMNINSWADLQNLPRVGHFCSIDVYQFVALINENWDKDFTKATARKKEPVAVNVEENNGETN